MWDNKVLKQKAKERMKVNYWKMLLVGLIIALVSGGWIPLASGVFLAE